MIKVLFGRPCHVPPWLINEEGESSSSVSWSSYAMETRIREKDGRFCQFTSFLGLGPRDSSKSLLSSTFDALGFWFSELVLVVINHQSLGGGTGRMENPNTVMHTNVDRRWPAEAEYSELFIWSRVPIVINSSSGNMPEMHVPAIPSNHTWQHSNCA